MHTRPLGPAAPAESAVGLGGMPLSIQERPTDEAAAIRVTRAALDAGMTLVDTADVYWLDGAARGALGAGRPPDAPAGGVRTVAARSGGGVHRPPPVARPGDPSVPLADSVEALADLRREGKLRWIGLSNVSVGEIAEACTVTPVVTVQNRLDPFFRETMETGVVARCVDAGAANVAPEAAASTVGASREPRLTGPPAPRAGTPEAVARTPDRHASSGPSGGVAD